MIIKWCCCIALAFFLSLWSGRQVASSRTNTASANQGYQDDKIQVAIPPNWSSNPVYRTTNKSRSSKDVIGVVLSDGSFDLYLLTHYSQTSGVIGGRFGEVAEYVVPWLKSDEMASCLDIFKQNLDRVSEELVRVDLILDPKREVRASDPFCSAIQRKVSRRVWAGAYFGYSRDNNRAPGFFIDTPLGTDTTTGDNQMVFAASVRTTTAGSLPMESDAQLRLFLAEIDRIIAGIKFLN